MIKKIISVMCSIFMIFTLFQVNTVSAVSYSGTLTMNVNTNVSNTEIYGPYKYYRFTVPSDGFYEVYGDGSYCGTINIYDAENEDWAIVTGVKAGTHTCIAQAYLKAGKNYYVETCSNQSTSVTYAIRLRPSNMEIGNKATFSLNNGVLTIAGEGDLWNYENSPFSTGDFYKEVDKIVIGEGITGISAWVFGNLYYVEDITLPSTLKKIGDYAFYDTGISDLVLPSSLTSIGKFAFFDTDLTQVTLQSKPTFGFGSFGNNHDLSKFIDGSGNEIPFEVLTENVSDNIIGITFGNSKLPMKDHYYSEYENFYWEINNKVLTVTGSGSIPTGISTGHYEFAYPWDGLSYEKVVFAGGVTGFASYTFTSISNIKEVVFGASIKNIPNNAFSNCENLETVVIPRSVQTIGGEAFKGDKKLVNVVDEKNIPYTKDEIASKLGEGVTLTNAFGQTQWLASTISAQSGDYIQKDSEGNVIGNIHYEYANGKLTFSGTGEIVVENDETTYPWYELSSAVTEVEIQEGITSISDLDWSITGSVKKVTLPKSLTSINNLMYGLFPDWDSTLESVNIPEGWKTLPDYAFMDYKALKKVTLPSTMESIGEYSFYGCSNLTSVSLPNRLKEIKRLGLSSTGLTKIVLPTGMTTLEYGALYNNKDVIELVLPTSITSLDNASISGNNKLTKIVDENGNDWLVSQIQSRVKEGENIDMVFLNTPWYIAHISNDIDENDTGTSEYTLDPYTPSIFSFVPSKTTNYTISASVKNQKITIFDENGTSIAVSEGKNSTISIDLEEGKKYTIQVYNITENPVTYTLSLKASDVTSCEEGHTYGNPKYIWSDDLLSCTFIQRCLAGDDEINEKMNIIVKTENPTCTQKGKETYTAKITVNDKDYTDTKVVETKDALGHYYDAKVVPASMDVDGKNVVTCLRCNDEKITVIPKASTITLSAVSSVYNGTVKSPTVIVKDANGKVLVEGVDYTVTYPSDMTSAGTKTIIVEGKGNYTGTKELMYTINKASYTPTAKVYSGTYDGKAHTITLSNIKAGSTIKYRTSPTGTWSKTKPKRTKVGKTTVYYKITKKNYKDITGNKTITIKPKGTTISKITPISKGMKVYVKKQATQTTGYQVRYSTSSKMSSPKTVTIKSYKTTSTTIKKLKAKKKYYVQVRTYKTVSGVKYYSAWSKSKYTTTKV